MTVVTQVEAGSLIPQLTALEFALLIAAHRVPGLSLQAACSRIGHWFCVPLDCAEVTRAARRLTFRGLLDQGDGLRATPAALDPSTRILGGMIRLIDNERGHFDVALLAHLAARKDPRHDHV